MKIIFLLIVSSLISLHFANAADTHPQICENIRYQISENCSEESDTWDDKNKVLIKRTYEECYSQDLDSTVGDLNNYMVNELGIYPYDQSGETEEILCDKDSV